ncbi:MAG TPA: VOC family protein [Chitinophagaceae bacterium]|nr:VOC family protein [Chitinophagaceae bacterium]HPH32030.1 VOC family protein [Chitinophagaceae bacterium]HPN59536.1 VOC family protein [Chitinophagaceae bacterium]
MSNNIHPCLWFNGNAKEAAEFYCSLFPESRITFDTPMVVNFYLHGQKFMGLNGGPMFKFNPSVSMFVTSENNEEIDALYAKLIEGGMVMMPLDKYEWSDYYAFVQDKFGLAWQLYKGSYSAVNQKITPCFLFTDDHFGKAEAAVNYYTALFPSSSINGILLYQPDEGEQVAGKVKHSQFIIDDKVFMAMDGAGNHGFSFNEAISFVVECKDQEEIDKYWNQLTANGGAESMCGWLKDPFGVSWQIIPAKMGQIMTDSGNGAGAMKALMQMKKIVIAELESSR